VVATGHPATAQAGTPDGNSAEAAMTSIRQAVADVIAGRASAVVTNPIAKNASSIAPGFGTPDIPSISPSSQRRKTIRLNRS